MARRGRYGRHGHPRPDPRRARDRDGLRARPGSAAAESSCAGAETEAAELGTVALEQSVLCVINEQRGAAGIAPVRSNPKLAQAAARHSNDMVQNGFFSHTSPGGATFIDRISATGYMRGARSWLVGENLVWGTGQLSTPASMVDAWMDSPPHRANLLRARFREIGLSGVSSAPRTRPPTATGSPSPRSTEPEPGT